MLKVALVGVGNISSAHIPVWNKIPEAELVALCDVRPERMDRYPEVNHYTDVDEMLEKEEIDILDICLPTYLHAEVSIKALNKKINVITEKPISLNEEDVEKIYAAAKGNGVHFMVAHVLRFWDSYLKLKEVYDNKTYGELLSGNMSRLGNIPKSSWDGWMMDEKRSGLTPFDLHIHDLDFIVYAFGSPKMAVPMRNKRPEQDYFSVRYDFDGFFINTEAAWYNGMLPFQSSFRFQFEKAVVVTESGKLMAYHEDGSKVNLIEKDNAAVGEAALFTTDGYFNEIRYFTDCVLENKPADRIKPDELETVLKLLHSI